MARHGNLALLSAVGYQDRENQVRMRTDRIFQIMSMAKPITSVGIVMLMEEGRLALTDPVEKYLPEFRGQMLEEGCSADGNGTIAACRSPPTHHHSRSSDTYLGIAGRPQTTGTSLDALGYGNGHARVTGSAGFRAWDKMALQQCGDGHTRPHHRGRESAAVRAVHLRTHPRSPLAMQDTFYFPSAERQNRIAAVYTDDTGKLTCDEADLRRGAKYPAPEGGLYSTANDMANFYQMMLNKGTLDGHRFLSPIPVELMTTVQTGDLKAGFSPGIGFGLGWAVVKDPQGMFRLNSLGTYGHVAVIAPTDG